MNTFVRSESSIPSCSQCSDGSSCKSGALPVPSCSSLWQEQLLGGLPPCDAATPEDGGAPGIWEVGPELPHLAST